MPTFNVHLYREMRLPFLGVEADTPEQAAKMVAEYPSEKAASYEDCESVTLAALVDLAGDKDYSQSVTIDLDPVTTAAQELYEALAHFERAHRQWAQDHATFHKESNTAENTELYVIYKKACAALAKARGESLPEAVIPQHQTTTNS